MKTFELTKSKPRTNIRAVVITNLDAPAWANYEVKYARWVIEGRNLNETVVQWFREVKKK